MSRTTGPREDSRAAGNFTLGAMPAGNSSQRWGNSSQRWGNSSQRWGNSSQRWGDSSQRWGNSSQRARAACTGACRERTREDSSQRARGASPGACPERPREDSSHRCGGFRASLRGIPPYHARARARAHQRTNDPKTQRQPTQLMHFSTSAPSAPPRARARPGCLAPGPPWCSSGNPKGAKALTRLCGDSPHGFHPRVR